MPEFRRKRGFDYWHRCRDCACYPFDDYFPEVLAAGSPVGRLCGECLDRDRLAACTGTFN